MLSRGQGTRLGSPPPHIRPSSRVCSLRSGPLPSLLVPLPDQGLPVASKGSARDKVQWPKRKNNLPSTIANVQTGVQYDLTRIVDCMGMRPALFWSQL